MSFLTKVKGIPSHLPHGVARQSGYKGFLYDKGERALMAAALGAAKGYWYDKLVFKGIGVEAIVGVLGYLGAALAGGNAHLERAGDTGLTTYIYATAASWGHDKSGRAGKQAASLPAGAKKKAVVGEIPPRSGGAFLDANDMAQYANRL